MKKIIFSAVLAVGLHAAFAQTNNNNTNTNSGGSNQNPNGTYQNPSGNTGTNGTNGTSGTYQNPNGNTGNGTSGSMDQNHNGMNQNPNGNIANPSTKGSYGTEMQYGNDMDYMNMKQSEIQSGQIPSNISGTFNQKYPNQSNVTWYKSSSGYTAMYPGSDNMQSQVMYDANGKMMGSGTQIQTTTLPSTSSAYLKKNYSGKTYNRAYQVSSANGEKYYQVWVDGKWVRFDSKGNYVSPK